MGLWIRVELQQRNSMKAVIASSTRGSLIKIGRMRIPSSRLRSVEGGSHSPLGRTEGQRLADVLRLLPAAICSCHSQADVVVVIEETSAPAGVSGTAASAGMAPLALPSRRRMALKASSRERLAKRISRQAGESDSIAVMPRLM